MCSFQTLLVMFYFSVEVGFPQRERERDNFALVGINIALHLPVRLPVFLLPGRKDFKQTIGIIFDKAVNSHCTGKNWVTGLFLIFYYCVHSEKNPPGKNPNPNPNPLRVESNRAKMVPSIHNQEVSEICGELCSLKKYPTSTKK